MHVLITGGTGMIGQALSKSLIDDDNEVTILTRNPYNTKSTPVGANLQWWDAKTTEGLAEVIESADAVVHLAGENLADGRWTDRETADTRQSRSKWTGAGQSYPASRQQTGSPGSIVGSGLLRATQRRTSRRKQRPRQRLPCATMCRMGSSHRDGRRTRCAPPGSAHRHRPQQ